MAIKLEDYNRKRNFEKTGEPKGETEKTEEALRFVVQHHIHKPPLPFARMRYRKADLPQGHRLLQYRRR